MRDLPLPNYTNMPNSIIDEMMKELSGAEFKVISLILRYTSGCCKKEAYISDSYFEKKCAISIKTLKKCCDKLESDGLIEITRKFDGIPNCYEVVLNEDSTKKEVKK